MKKRSKRYKNMIGGLDKTKAYSIAEAVGVLSAKKSAKFNETYEVNINLGIDASKSDQLVRGVVKLPHGTGKEPKVLVFAKGEKVKEAEEAGADFIGNEEIVEKIKAGWIGFDKVIATPDTMSDVGKLGKILGTKKLMPSPKTGTVTFDVSKAVKEVKGGRIEFKTDKQGSINVGIGKTAFGGDQIEDNFNMLMDAITRAKPQTAKGTYIKDIYVSTTMGPGLKVEYKYSKSK